MEINDRTLGVKEIKCKVCQETLGVDNYYIFTTKHKQKNREYYYKRYRATCKRCQRERAKPYMKKWYKENKERVSTNGAKWHQNNKDRLYKKRKERLNNDEAFRIKEGARIALRKAIKYKKGKRAFKVNELLGCTGKEAYDYLVSIGYDEDKHTIDHIIPYAYFNLLIKEHQLVCFNYRNLQPLSRLENITKSNHLIPGWENVLERICKELSIDINKVKKRPEV